ncbi:PepSY-associated TM helix domain-containing protein [Paraburkholderia sp. MMS20-SJTN17]|uniref:PepSY-associated TM helix domain-containing protein n=1 Tax=Paraburkholderia translucens TaxID=2886945 RepID=A0ABS8KDQ9_9BURK|nr:PepSY-associated TM helix domain-containing protein [Paraburkholderia sp. MMS20-SJTN17]MCC8402903.1 PepSY-associated TM helix domain-containing protein [Paraburkholderia sp. MMS20-SJTN17]
MSGPDTIDIQPPAAGEHEAHEPRGFDGNEPKSRQQRSRRAAFIKWLRKVHGWVGLWGAALGLLFGTTGFFLNHRGGPLRVSTGEPQVSVMQVPLPQPAPETPHELANWLRQELKIAGNPGRVQKEPEHAVAWGDRSVVQPEHWQLNFASPKENTSVEYWVGNHTVTIKRSANTFLATLTNLHKGVGLSIGWVLLIDTLAGSLILLSLTGVLLWTELNRRKTAGLALVAASIAVAVVLGTM